MTGGRGLRGDGWAGRLSTHIRIVLDRRWKGRGWLFGVPVALFGRQILTRNLQRRLDVLAPSGR
jgi:hypothetical protein